MATEEQTTLNGDSGLVLYTGYAKRAGQRLTISNRIVSKLSFKMFRSGSPTGDITFEIRKVSDNSLIVSKVQGDASALPLKASEAWKEVTFTTPVTINEEVRICAHYEGGDGSNNIRIRAENTDVKAGEYATWMPDTTWSALTTWDALYIYTYSSGDAVYPNNDTDPLRRVSGIKRTFWAGIGGQSVYQVELALGGMGTTYVSPIGSREPPSAVTPSPDLKSTYDTWLNYYITNNLAGLIKTFGHIPTYEEWTQWIKQEQAPYFPKYF